MIGSVSAGFAFWSPAWFVMVLAVTAALWLRARRRPHAQLGASSLLAGRSTPLPRTWRHLTAAGVVMFEAFAGLLLVAAMARPVFVEIEPPALLGRDVLLCLDRSSSMAQTDLAAEASRWSVGKRAAHEFLLSRPQDRLGIVTFARYADLVCPPTLDHDAATELLAGVELVDAEGPEDATAIGAAIGLAAEMLQRAATAGRVIVLLSDGEENVAVAGAPDQIAPLHAGQWCRDHGIRVHCIALGDTGSLDTSALQQVAKLSGGRFFSAADEPALRAVYAAIDQLERAQFAQPGVRVTEWFAWPLLAGMLAAMLAHLLRASRWAGQP